MTEQPVPNGHRRVGELHDGSVSEFVARGPKGRKGNKGRRGPAGSGGSSTVTPIIIPIVFGSGGGGGFTVGEAVYGRPAATGRVVDAEPAPAQPNPDSARFDRIEAAINELREAMINGRAPQINTNPAETDAARMAREEAERAEQQRRAEEQAAREQQARLEGLNNTGPEELRVRNPENIDVEHLTPEQLGHVLVTDPMFRVVNNRGTQSIEINSPSIHYYARLQTALQISVLNLMRGSLGLPFLARSLSERNKEEKLTKVLSKGVVDLHHFNQGHLRAWINRQTNEEGGYNFRKLQEWDNEQLVDEHGNPRPKNIGEKMVDVGDFDAEWANRLRILQGLNGEVPTDHPEYLAWYDFLSRSVNLDQLVKIGKEQWGEPFVPAPTITTVPVVTPLPTVTPAATTTPAPAATPAEHPNPFRQEVDLLQARLLELEAQIKERQNNRGRISKLRRKDANGVDLLRNRRDNLRNLLLIAKRKYRAEINFDEIRQAVDTHPAVAERDHMFREQIAEKFKDNAMELEGTLTAREIQEITENPTLAFRRCWTNHPNRRLITSTIVNVGAGILANGTPLAPLLFVPRWITNWFGVEAKLHEGEGSKRTKLKNVKKISDEIKLADMGAHIRTHMRSLGEAEYTEAEEHVMEKYWKNALLAELGPVSSAMDNDQIKTRVRGAQTSRRLSYYDRQIVALADTDSHRRSRIIKAGIISFGITAVGPWVATEAIDLIGQGINAISHIPLPDWTPHLPSFGPPTPVALPNPNVPTLPGISPTGPVINHEILGINNGFYDPTSHAIVPGNHPDVGLYVDTPPVDGVNAHQAIVRMPNGVDQQVLMLDNARDYLDSTFQSHPVIFDKLDPVSHAAVSSGLGLDQAQAGDAMLHQTGVLGADQALDPFEKTGTQINLLHQAADANRPDWNAKYALSQWSRINLNTDRALPFINPGTVSEAIQHGGSYLTGNGAHVGDSIPVKLIGADAVAERAILGNVISR